MLPVAKMNQFYKKTKQIRNFSNQYYDIWDFL